MKRSDDPKKEEKTDEPLISAEFFDEVQSYIAQLESDTLRILKLRGDDKIDSQNTFVYFRSQERYRNTKYLLQYLLSFVEHLPTSGDISSEPINPFNQFKSFVEYALALLGEDDVIQTVLREHSESGDLTKTGLSSRKAQILETHRELLTRLETATKPVLEHYKILFQIIKELCEFWFANRKHEMIRVRRSDRYLYKLANALISRIPD